MTTEKNAEGYEKHIFAYLDILGFTNLVDNPKNESMLIYLMNSIHDQNASQSIKIEGTKENGQATVKPNIMSFSDHMIISIKHDPNLAGPAYEFDSLLHSVTMTLSQFCIHALTEGVALRGAIGYGDIYVNYTDKKSIIFGKNLIASINDESSLAIYPRIVVSSSLIPELEKIKSIKASGDISYPSIIIRDNYDGLFHVDYLGLLYSCLSKDRFSTLQKVSHYINKNYQSNTDPRIKSKWYWLKNYFNSKIPELIAIINNNNKLSDFTGIKFVSENKLCKLMITDDE
jgi:hypothetical protein